MKEQIEKIQNEALGKICEAKGLKELNDIRIKYLGKKGELTSVLRGMGSVSPEDRSISKYL